MSLEHSIEILQLPTGARRPWAPECDNIANFGMLSICTNADRAGEARTADAGQRRSRDARRRCRACFVVNDKGGAQVHGAVDDQVSITTRSITDPCGSSLKRI